MQITGTTSLSPMRQPGSMLGGQENQRLVFLYPMLFDSNTAKLQDILRDFLTVDFISQIKISNVLNIAINSTQIGVLGNGPHSVNPAQEVRKSLHYSLYDSPTPNSNGPQYIDHSQVNAYQEKLHNFLNFIRNQIRYDPKYQQYRPIISSITAQENLINIPLILGTKNYNAKAMSLYWILLVSLAWDIPLDSDARLNEIERRLNNLPNQKFAQLLFDPQYRAQIDARSSILPNHTRTQNRRTLNHPFSQTFYNDRDKAYEKRIAGLIQSEASQSLRDLRNCLNVARWDAETGHISYFNTHRRGSFATGPEVPDPTSIAVRTHFGQAYASFNSYVSNFILPILHSLEYITGPTPPHINLNELVDNFLANTRDSLSDLFFRLANIVTGQLRSELDTPPWSVASSSSPTGRDAWVNTSHRLKIILDSCQANAELTAEVKKLLITDLEPHIHLPIRFGATDVIRFGDSISQSGTRLKRHSITIDAWLKNILSDTSVYDSFMRAVRDRFRDAVTTFLHDPRSSLVPAVSDADFPTRHSQFYNFVYGGGNPATGHRQFNQFISTIETSIADLLEFFFLWNFMSYTCSYMRDIDVDIEVQKKDVLEFPNYTLVITLDILKFMFTLHSSRNFTQIMTSNATPDSLGLNNREFLLNLNDVKGMIATINQRLRVPNLFVVDTKTDTIYYQFMYMNRANKLSLSAIENYVKHQVDILPGF